MTGLGFYAGLVLESLGHDVVVLDDWGRCGGILETIRPPPRLRLVDSPPGSKPLRRILRRCDVFLLLWDPWDAGACSSWSRVILGYALDAVESSVERLVVGLPGGAFAWSGERVECGVFPRRAPGSLLYGVQVAAAAFVASSSQTLIVVYPPLLHRDEVYVKGRPEPINWFERLLETGVLAADVDARLTVLDYRDAAETLAVLAEGESVGWYCIGGVEVSARDVASLAERVSWVRGMPSTLIVEGGGVRRRTLALFSKLGVHVG